MPDEQPQASRKRPGGALDKAAIKQIHLLSASDPNFLGNWLPGEAMSRLNRAPVYALPPDVLQSLVGLMGRPNAQGLTINPSDESINHLNQLRALYPLNKILAGPAADYPEPVRQHFRHSDQPVSFYPQPTTPEQALDPTSEANVTARHEIIHQATTPAIDEILDRGKKIPIPEHPGYFMGGPKGETGWKYSPEEQPYEYPAFLGSDPTEIGLTPEEGKQQFTDYINKIIAPQDPGTANRLRQKYGIAAPSTTQADRSYSNPNVTF